MACELQPGTCRRKHIAPHLDDAEQDGTDWEARCPVCGHDGFRISQARVKSYRNIWTCACKRCTCKVGSLRVALLKLGIMPACLGIYDGAIQKSIPPETARSMDLAISDILAMPHLRPADMRIILAEAQGRKVPEDFSAFVKFAMTQGVGRRQAYEAAARWCRPSDSHPQTGGGVVDTSRSTDADDAVKSPMSDARDSADSADSACGFRTDSQGDARAVSAQDGTDSTVKPAA